MVKKLHTRFVLLGSISALSLLLSVAAYAQDCFSSCQSTGDSICPNGIGCVPKMCGDSDNECAFCQDNGSRQCLCPGGGTVNISTCYGGTGGGCCLIPTSAGCRSYSSLALLVDLMDRLDTKGQPLGGQLGSGSRGATSSAHEEQSSDSEGSGYAGGTVPHTSISPEAGNH